MTHLSSNHEAIKDTVEQLFAGKPDWMKFFREVMGLHGIVRRTFPTPQAMAEFEQSETYRLIHNMMAELRKQPLPEGVDDEEEKVITVRIPQSMHEALQIEAFEHRTSMNKLCISKLLQSIEAEKVPAAFQGKRKKAGATKEKKVEAGL